MRLDDLRELAHQPEQEQQIVVDQLAVILQKQSRAKVRIAMTSSFLDAAMNFENCGNVSSPR